MATNNAINLPWGTDGQLPIGKTGGNYAPASITSSGGTITMTPGANSLNMEVASSPGDGAWQHVANATISNDSEVVFNNLSSSYSYKILIEFLVTANDSVDIFLLMSTNNGSSFLNSDYHWSCGNLSTTPDWDLAANNSDSEITLTEIDLGNDTNESLCSEIFLFNPAASNSTYLTHRTIYVSDSPAFANVYGYGGRQAAEAINAIELSAQAGNLSTGIARLYRLAQS